MVICIMFDFLTKDVIIKNTNNTYLFKTRFWFLYKLFPQKSAIEPSERVKKEPSFLVDIMNGRAFKLIGYSRLARLKNIKEKGLNTDFIRADKMILDLTCCAILLGAFIFWLT